jgi:Cof subfamily protein (haloacid dehalogenase superfamily)
MKNIYITDLDHTFLQNDLSLSDYTKKIWNSYANEAIMSVATARTYRKTMQFLQDVSLNAPLILLDGALVATQDKKIIETKFIQKNVADEIISEGAKMGIYPFVLALGEGKLNEVFLHSSCLNIYQKEVLTRYVKEDNLQESKNICAMEQNFKVVYMGEEQLIKDLAQTLQEKFGDSLKYIVAPEAYVGCYFLTLLHKDADKSHGIKSVSEYLGFDLQKLTVFGDNFNDVGMFELAGTSIAVANAQEGVKALANVVLEHTNDEDAVAKYLESLKNGSKI